MAGLKNGMLNPKPVPKMMASNSSELSSLNRTLRPWISLIQRR
jgi:hypothetical protein